MSRLKDWSIMVFIPTVLVVIFASSNSSEESKSAEESRSVGQEEQVSQKKYASILEDMTDRKIVAKMHYNNYTHISEMMRSDYIKIALAYHPLDYLNNLDYFTNYSFDAEGFAKKKFTIEQIAEMAIGYTRSLEYIEDEDEYKDDPKTARETLFDGGGDCEDLVILGYSMLKAAGIKAVVIHVPGHVMLGVAGKFSGDSITHNGVKYYVVEMTDPDRVIGDCPDEYTKNVTIYQ